MPTAAASEDLSSADWLHLDCPSGISGDMFLGALLDLGMPLAVLEGSVASLGLEGVTLERRAARRGGVAGTRFRVLQDGVPVDGADPEERPAQVEAGGESARAADPERAVAHTPLREILGLLEGSALPEPVRDRAVAMFRGLGEAEAEVHGGSAEQVHFHEVGAVDSVVDIVGACAARQWLEDELGVAGVSCGVVATGSGTIATAHGKLPVPAPATALLLRGVSLTAGPPGELTTPTGALVLRFLVDSRQGAPNWRLLGQGFGLGQRELAGQPNVLRALLGRRDESAAGVPRHPVSEIAVVECEIDDVSGEAVAWAMESVREEGALDAFVTPVLMKKGRPGSLLTVLARPADAERLAALLMALTGSLGCRWHPTRRFEARRRVRAVETPFGTIRVKSARLGDGVHHAPEADDCVVAARRSGASFQTVYEAARAARMAEEQDDP